MLRGVPEILRGATNQIYSRLQETILGIASARWNTRKNRNGWKTDEFAENGLCVVE